jgi:protein arginine kinase activator
VCPQCGLSYAEFRRLGRLGCEACYETFRDDLKPLLRRVHGSTAHAGAVPAHLERGLESRREIKRLRSELDLAVRREEYERAAELRDAIREIEERARRESNAEAAPPWVGGDAARDRCPPGNSHVDVRDDDE